MGSNLLNGNLAWSLSETATLAKDREEATFR